MLIIDDGSTDMSSAICDSYASKDSRVKVFHKSNGGVASARQVGIDNLQGDYVIQADADDWMEKDMLRILMEAAQNNNADVTMCDFTKVSTGGGKKTYVSQSPTSLNCHDIIEDLIYEKILGVLWNKLVKTNCYKSIRFNINMTKAEDLEVCLKLFQRSLKIIHLPLALYNYDVGVNTNSLMKHYDYKVFMSDKILLESIFKLVRKDISFYPAYRYRYTLYAYIIFKNNFLNNLEYFKEYHRHICHFLKSNHSLPVKFITSFSAMELKRICFIIYRMFSKV